jgi:hypothetical protein
MAKKHITQIFNLLKAVFAFLFALVILYFAAALVLSYMKTHPLKQDCLTDKEIYITTNGVHLFSPAKQTKVFQSDVVFILRPVAQILAQCFKVYFPSSKHSGARCLSCSIFASSKKTSGRNFSCAISC